MQRNLTENGKTSSACRSLSRPQHTENKGESASRCWLKHKRFMRYSLIARRRCQLFRWPYPAITTKLWRHVHSTRWCVGVMRFAPVFVASTAAATAWLVLVPPWVRPRRTSLAPSAWRSAAVGWRLPVTHQLQVSLLLSFPTQRAAKPLLLAPKYEEKSKQEENRTLNSDDARRTDRITFERRLLSSSDPLSLDSKFLTLSCSYNKFKALTICRLFHSF